MRFQCLLHNRSKTLRRAPLFSPKLRFFWSPSSSSPAAAPPQPAAAGALHGERRGRDDDGEEREALSCRVERLRRGESVVSAFQGWMGEGFAIHRGDIFHAINRLRKLRMNKKALEEIHW